MSGRKKGRIAWTWADVKCELAKRGYTLAALGELHGVSRYAIAKVKNRPSAPVQALIADKLDEHPETIWPNRYSTRRAA